MQVQGENNAPVLDVIAGMAVTVGSASSWTTATISAPGRGSSMTTRVRGPIRSARKRRTSGAYTTC